MAEPYRCPTCFVRAELCLCAELPRVRPSAHFLILRHVLEQWKVSNTARWVALALGERCTILEYAGVGVTHESLEAELTGTGTWLLYPEGPLARPAAADVRRVVVLDASWSQSRRMLQRIPALRKLPRLALPPPIHKRRRLRRPVLKEGMSTIEAIAGAIAILDGEGVAAPLDRLYSSVVLRAVAGRVRLTPELLAEIRAGDGEAQAVTAALKK